MIIAMNIYFNPKETLLNQYDYTDCVFNRMKSNEFQDLRDGIDILPEKDYDLIIEFLDKATTDIEMIKEYITVIESSIRFDNAESQECGLQLLAYLIDVDFNTEMLLKKLNPDSLNKTKKDMVTAFKSILKETYLEIANDDSIKAESISDMRSLTASRFRETALKKLKNQ